MTEYEVKWGSDKLEVTAKDSENGKDVGIWEGEKRNNSDDKKPYVMINNLNVIPTYRRKGIAEEMFKIAFHACEQKGIKKFMLYVHKEDTSAISLYKKLGFLELKGKNKGYYEKTL